MSSTTEAPTPEAIKTGELETETKRTKPQAEQLPEVLTVDEAARLLRVNRDTVYACNSDARNSPGVRQNRPKPPTASEMRCYSGSLRGVNQASALFIQEFP